MARELLFSVTKKDLEITTFTAGGPGGQHQNKVATAVRIIHRASGAVGEARDSRSQHANIKAAFKRMAETPEMKRWIRVKAAEMLSRKTLDQIVDEALADKNLKLEIKDEKGRWIEGSPIT
jgi:protein subunit release factor B